MPSHKSSPKPRGVQAPQRSNGRLRVAAILEAAEAVIAEKGYESATMAEIAARSGTKIGSLYRFFPNKESLADSIVMSAHEGLKAMFDHFDIDARALSIQALADGLLALFVRLFSRRAVRKLSASDDWSIKPEEFRNTALQRTAKTLTTHSSALPKKSAADIAAVLLSHAKTMATYEETFGSAPSVMLEFRDMTRLYLQSKLGRHRVYEARARRSKPRDDLAHPASPRRPPVSDQSRQEVEGQVA